MKKIIYYIASSIDGYIAGENNDVSQFLYQGKGVEKYITDLQNFKTVIMGRNTYEIAYAFGLPPGQPAYQGMEHFIFSNKLTFENPAPNVHVVDLTISKLLDIRKQSVTDIYMCGGGKFAEWLLENNQIDQLKIKVNPIILGKGLKLFGDISHPTKWMLTNCEKFEDGMLILTYDFLIK